MDFLVLQQIWILDYSGTKTKPDALSAASYILAQVKNSSALEVVNFWTGASVCSPGPTDFCQIKSLII